ERPCPPGQPTAVGPHSGHPRDGRWRPPVQAAFRRPLRGSASVKARRVPDMPMLSAMADKRVVSFQPRAILIAVGVLLAVAVALRVVWVTRSVLIWMLIALFLAMALNPAVEVLVRRGMRRGIAVGIVFVGAILIIAAIAATF